MTDYPYTVEPEFDNIHGTSWGPFKTAAEVVKFIGTREDVYVVVKADASPSGKLYIDGQDFVKFPVQA